MKYLQYSLEYIFIVVIVIAILCGLAKIVNSSLDKSEISACSEYQQQEKDIPTFFLAKWQDEMCQSHNIVIDAPIYE